MNAVIRAGVFAAENQVVLVIVRQQRRSNARIIRVVID